MSYVKSHAEGKGLTATEIKELAQDVILMHGVWNSREFMSELVAQHLGISEYSFKANEEFYAAVEAQLIKQGNRVLAIFGYDK